MVCKDRDARDLVSRGICLFQLTVVVADLEGSFKSNQRNYMFTIAFNESVLRLIQVLAFNESALTDTGTSL